MIVMRHEIKKSNDKFEEQIARLRFDQQNKVKTMWESRNTVPFLNECIATLERIPGVQKAQASFGYLRDYGSITVDVSSCMTIIDVAAEFERRGWWFDYEDLEKKDEDQHVTLHLWTLPNKKGVNIGLSLWLKDGPTCKVVEYEEYEPVKKYRYECA